MRQFLCAILVLGTACVNQKTKQLPISAPSNTSQVKSEQPGLIIQPLGQLDPALIKYLQLNIPAQFKISVQVATEKKLPARAFYLPRARYRADTLLSYLQALSTKQFPYVMGITAKDMETRKGENPHWGVMGLGFHPGQAAVVSTYRIKKTKQTQQVLAQRLTKVVIHELGHNFGLPHCSNQQCIMVDAEGKDKLDGEIGFCKICHEFLANRGFL